MKFLSSLPLLGFGVWGFGFGAQALVIVIRVGGVGCEVWG